LEKRFGDAILKYPEQVLLLSVPIVTKENNFLSYKIIQSCFRL